MLQFFQEYFGINYSLPKQDMIALPDFPGAMENWGLITYGLVTTSVRFLSDLNRIFKQILLQNKM